MGKEQLNSNLGWQRRRIILGVSKGGFGAVVAIATEKMLRQRQQSIPSAITTGPVGGESPTQNGQGSEGGVSAREQQLTDRIRELEEQVALGSQPIPETGQQPLDGSEREELEALRRQSEEMSTRPTQADVDAAYAEGVAAGAAEWKERFENMVRQVETGSQNCEPAPDAAPPTVNPAMIAPNGEPRFTDPAATPAP